ncbi:MAG TPA: class D sortase [Anaerolineae bacterium]|nr:class D sortase [Anaerolineae bacterium]
MSINPDKLTTQELEQLLYERKRAERQQRLARLDQQGRRVNTVPPPPAPRPGQPFLAPPNTTTPPPTSIWRQRLNRLLFSLELVAFLGFLVSLWIFFSATRQLNQDATTFTNQPPAAITTPTAVAAAPLMNVVVLPSGHKPPVDGRAPEPGEAGDIPGHLLPIINSYTPPPIPTPGPEQARRIQIPALNIDKPIVQGDDWEALKKGVGQHIGSAIPGQDGNLVLSAHNDIYGEIFRHLDDLTPGDEVIVYTERNQYTYVVRAIEVVEPTDVWVMAPTEHASATLISCYPYLVNTKRIIVFADLVT